MWTDAAGRAHAKADGAVRIVPLAPSLTALLADLGLADSIVARPGDCVRSLAVAGGTQDVDLDRLRALAPTHVLLSRDVVRSEVVDEIRGFVPHVIVTDAGAPDDEFALHDLLGGVFDRQAEAERLSADLRAALEAVRAKPWPARRVLYATWQDPWTTVSRATYASRMLALVNWATWPDDASTPQACVDGDCSRPNAPGTRYPNFRWSDALVRDLDAVLLSTEPYGFTEDHADALERQIGKPVLLVDGALVSGTGGAAAGIRYLQAMTGSI